MKLRNTFFIMVGIWCLLCLCLRCSLNLASLQTGRTLGKGNKEISLSYNHSKAPELCAIGCDDNPVEFDKDITKVVNIGMYTQFALYDKLDLGLEYSNTTIGFDLKHRISKSNESIGALSIGGGLGLTSGGAYINLPLYISIHPVKKFAICITPRQIFRNSKEAYIDGWIRAFGVNLGLLYGGKNIKVGVTGGLYNANFEDYNIPLYNIGIGIKFNILKDGKSGQGPLGPNREKGNIPK